MISVVIPTFNCAGFIEETLSSVAGQSCKDLEIIVVDDGSSDDTVSHAENYVNQNNIRARVISNTRKKGAAGARNTGIDAAQGDMIAFIDADDKWLPEKLEHQLAFMEEHQAAFSFTGYEFADEECRGTGKTVRVPEAIRYEEALKNTTIFTSTVMFDMRKLTKDDIYFPYVESEDTANWWKILRLHGKAYGLDEALTLYRRSAGTLSSNKFKAVGRTWRLYRRTEKLPLIKSLYCFTCYIARAVKRRL